MHRISSREFNRDIDKAKRAAKQGHVFITDTIENLLSLEAEN